MRTYKATGINLKAVPLGEADRLLTILTREHGLVKVIAAGARKPNSKIGGRSGLFVVNDLLIKQGKSLDKISQAETLESYPGLGVDLAKLTAGQYLAELVLCQALSDQPQEDLFALLNEHLKRIERSPAAQVLPHLIHGVFQLMALAGVAPQTHYCCVTGTELIPNLHQADWQVGFSIPAGGAVSLIGLLQLANQPPKPSVPPHSAGRVPKPVLKRDRPPGVTVLPVREMAGNYPALPPGTTALEFGESVPIDYQPVEYRPSSSGKAQLNLKISGLELWLLQQLANPTLPAGNSPLNHSPAGVGLETALDGSAQVHQAWRSLEKLLRRYAHYHFDRPIRAAALLDVCFNCPP